MVNLPLAIGIPIICIGALIIIFRVFFSNFFTEWLKIRYFFGWLVKIKDFDPKKDSPWPMIILGIFIILIGLAIILFPNLTIYS